MMSCLKWWKAKKDGMLNESITKAIDKNLDTSKQG
jgi:hypothetical protein